MKKKIFKHIDMPFILIVCFLLLAMYLTIATSAKYTSSDGQTSSARVAVWQLFSQGSTDTLNMVSGGSSQDYNLTVRSTSDVSSIYSIEFTNVPNDITVSIDGGAAISPTSGKVTFSNVGVFNIESGIIEREHVITFNAPLSANVVSNNQVGVNIKFEQKD